MPRLYVWARVKHHRSHGSTSRGYFHRDGPRNADQIQGLSACGPLAKESKAMVARPENAYMQIGEPGVKPTTWWDNYDGPGTQKTKSIELTTQDAMLIEPTFLENA